MLPWLLAMLLVLCGPLSVAFSLPSTTRSGRAGGRPVGPFTSKPASSQPTLRSRISSHLPSSLQSASDPDVTSDEVLRVSPLESFLPRGDKLDRRYEVWPSMIAVTHLLLSSQYILTPPSLQYYKDLHPRHRQLCNQPSHRRRRPVLCGPDGQRPRPRRPVRQQSGVLERVLDHLLFAERDYAGGGEALRGGGHREGAGRHLPR